MADRKILYVEDSSSIRLYVKMGLAREHKLAKVDGDLEVELAENYPQALERFNEIQSYDALLLDMNLGSVEGTGADLARIARRELNYQRNIVMFSGDDLKSAMEKTKEIAHLHAGIRYVSKPAPRIKEVYEALFS